MKQVCLFSHFYATVGCAAGLAVPIEVGSSNNSISARSTFTQELNLSTVLRHYFHLMLHYASLHFRDKYTL